jgi:cysteinyl-tRNA synthetase
MDLKFYNSLTRKIESFVAHDSNEVGVYTCGPTVYNYVTVGNWRTYALGDLITRVLRYNGYNINYFMNITDVGHLTGDNSGDADTGDDRMEKAKQREGKNAWDIAKFYTEDFKSGYKKLNLFQPKEFLPATSHITEQIALVQKLFDKGLAYTINDGVYFDTNAYENTGYKYGELSNLDQIMAGARVEFNKEKRNERDFALWKFSPKGEKRDMEWNSPWGIGFPGWHIECSAMSMKYLGEQFDLHIGGEDLKSTHHPNEIAQSQGATGKAPFVRYWIHGAFLQVDGGRMGKSLGNAYTISDIEKRSISPLALKYFYLSGHYRSPLNFTWEALSASSKALARINEYVSLHIASQTATEEIIEVNSTYEEKFLSAINNDLNMPSALAVLHELIHDDKVFPNVKIKTILNFDEVLGLELGKIEDIPPEVTLMFEERRKAREEKNWALADQLREKIEAMGYTGKDTDSGTIISKL